MTAHPTYYTRYGKRIFDIVFTILLIVAFAWLMLLIILVYVLTAQTPIVFAQPRIGRNGKTFTMLKFRTLSPDTTKSLQQRRFAWGDVLRLTNLDELPQFWNVLKGEMSLIGPRPLPVEYESLFTAGQQKRHTVLPGITGLAQVSGKNSLTWNDKFNLDIQYVREISFRTDCIILLKTVTLVLSFKRDVSLQEKELTK